MAVGARFARSSYQTASALSLSKIYQIGRNVRSNGSRTEADCSHGPMGEPRAPDRPMRSESGRGGGAIRGLGESVWLLLGSGDFVINGEYWIKSRLIAPMECQEILLMASN